MRLNGSTRTCVWQLLALIGILLLAALPVAAQTIDEDEFWLILQRTAATLNNADEAQREVILSEIRGLWQGVNTVQLSDEQTISIDMQWLTENEAPLEQLEGYVNALLDYRVRGRSFRETAATLDSLNRILQDSRFHYPTPTPVIIDTSDTTPDNQLQIDPLPSPELSQIILIAVGVATVIVVLGYLARGLNVQPTTLDASENGDDPTTSTQAHEFAQASEAVQDYRAAIRYLYLACLLLLDERGVLRYDPTLTNRELLRQVNNKSVHELLRGVVQTFDRVWYGFAPVNEKLYSEFRHSVEQLRTLAR